MAKQSKDTVGTAGAQVTETVKADVFSKEQILASAKFANRRDLLTVLLNDSRKYSILDVEKVMDDWFKRGVK